jgi:hypothetical protein
MTPLLWRILEIWSGRRFVPTQAMLDVAPPETDCARRIRAAIREARP